MTLITNTFLFLPLIHVWAMDVGLADSQDGVLAVPS